MGLSSGVALVVRELNRMPFRKVAKKGRKESAWLIVILYNTEYDNFVSHLGTKNLKNQRSETFPPRPASSDPLIPNLILHCVHIHSISPPKLFSVTVLLKHLCEYR